MITNKALNKMTLAVGAVAAATERANAKMDTAAVGKALEILKTYDWGDDRNTLNPIDEAIIATHEDPDARMSLEKSLVDALTGGLSRSAQDFVCRKLRVIGTAQSVDSLAALLPDENTSHIARYALERIPDPKAIAVIRDALPQVSTKLKPGMIGALGVRRHRRSVRAIAALLNDPDVSVARAAAHSLGLIATPGAAKRLSAFAKEAPDSLKIEVADACLLCADQLLADGRKEEAVSLYTELKGADQPKQVQVAAMKGLLTAAAQ